MLIMSRSLNISCKNITLILSLLMLNVQEVYGQILSGPPRVTLQDQTNVDLMSRLPMFSGTDVSIGNGALALSHQYIIDNTLENWNRFRDSYAGSQLGIVGCGVQVSFGSLTECFYGDGSAQYPYVPVSQNGATLVNNANGTSTYTTRDGSIYTISTSYKVTNVKYPSGLEVSINYVSPSPGYERIQSVTQNNGLQLKYIYQSNSPTSGAWRTITNIIALNSVVDYCNPVADTCSFSRSWPTATYSWTDFPVTIGANTGNYHYFTITDQAGLVSRFTADTGYRITAYKPPTSSSDSYTYRNCRPEFTINGTLGNDGVECIYQVSDRDALVYGGVFDAKFEGRTWQYRPAFAIAGYYFANSSTHPDGPIMNVTSMTPQTPTGPSPSSFGNVTAFDGTIYQYSTTVPNRLVTVTVPGQVPNTFTYDGRGNITESRRIATAGSGVADIFVSAGFDSVCTNQKTCNKPNWTRDAKGNQTDYTYSPDHGGVLTETGPAVNGIRPQTRYSYTQRYAWYKNSSGVQVQAATPIWLLTQKSFCKTGAASGNGCAIAGDEVKITYEYGPASGANNLFLRGVVEDSGGLALRTCYQYDATGNKISETQPKAGLTACP
jgi:YD repeat-containing protein